MNLQEAGDAARVRHSPSRQAGGTLAVEPGISDAVVDALRRRGHHVVRSGGGIMGGYQAIMINPRPACCTAAATRARTARRWATR